MKILVIDSGGRGHALGDKLKQSKKPVELFFASGNAGTTTIGKNVNIKSTDVNLLLKFAKQTGIDLTLVGTENTLFAAVVDEFKTAGLRIFGPTKVQAQIEESKAFAKNVMNGLGIYTAAHNSFSDYEKALAYVRTLNAPCFVKASGPAEGKGAIPCQTVQEAEQALAELMVEKKFDHAADTVLIEEWLEGEELSAHAVCDGRHAVMFPFVRDHKREFDGDQGDMTGGMGAVGPVVMSESFAAKVKRDIVERLLPTFPFRGLLFPGIMATKKGPAVIEFNARFGDPETQVYMQLLESDLVDLLEASIDGTLAQQEIKWRGFAVCVVLASGGYPNRPQKGYPRFPITGIERAEKVPGVKVFHAGTAIQYGKLVTAGGRVLGVTSYHPHSLEGAIKRAYEAVKCIHFKYMRYREDIGKSSLS